MGKLGLFMKADEMFLSLGYKIILSCAGYARYEKTYSGHPFDDEYGDTIKLITIEYMGSGHYIFLCCEKTGLKGSGHTAMGVTEEELRAVNKRIKEMKRHCKE